MLKHNKKRNIGLLNEFFAQYIASAVVNFRYDDVEKAKSLWREHVISNKELSKELKLFDILYKNKYKDRNVAYNLLQNVKEHVRTLDQDAIEIAKTRLLHEINSQLNDPSFFDKSIENYRTNATIQLLMNTWRGDNKSSMFSEVSKLEDQILEHLTKAQEKLPPFDASLLNKTQEDIDQIVVNVFREKIDHKYSEILNDEQKKLVGLYVFSKNQKEAKATLVETLSSLRDKTLQGIEKELKTKSKKASNKKPY